MVKLTSRRDQNLQVLFESELIDSELDFRGENITSSINEFEKGYVTRYVLKPEAIVVKYMSQDNYINLLDMISLDGNLFDLESTEGDRFTKCSHRGNFKLKKNHNTQSDTYFYTGTLSLGVR